MYAKNRGVPLDYVEAINGFRKPLSKITPPPRSILGPCTPTARACHGSRVRAQMCLTLAAAHGDQEAVKYRDMIAERLTPAERAEARKLAREWKPKSEQ